MPFKDNRRATLVGEQTAGSTGQPYILEPGHDMLILIGAKRAMFPDGSQFESVGIKPDLAVTPSLNDIRQSKDTVVEAASWVHAGLILAGVRVLTPEES